MLRTFAIVIAGTAIFASLPLTNAWACDDDRYPCPIRSEALIQETVQAPDQLSTDQPQKKLAQPQKKAKQPASTNEKAHAKRDREAPRTAAGAKVSKPAAPEQASDAVTQKALDLFAGITGAGGTGHLGRAAAALVPAAGVGASYATGDPTYAALGAAGLGARAIGSQLRARNAKLASALLRSESTLGQNAPMRVSAPLTKSRAAAFAALLAARNE